MTESTKDDANKEASALDESIHALAQPLTALLFLLELGALKTDPQDWLTTIDGARTECLRAIQALEMVRSAAHEAANTGERS